MTQRSEGRNYRNLSRGLMRIMTAGGLGIALVLTAATGDAAMVSGQFSYQNGSPAKRRQLHFEDRASGDMYIAPTQQDGNFSADLPPGQYDLRAERGVVLKAKITVDRSDVNVGHVLEPAPLDFHRPFQHEGVGEAIVQNPAPATANLHGRPEEAMKYGGHTSVQPLGARPPQVMNAPVVGGGTADTNPPAPYPPPAGN